MPDGGMSGGTRMLAKLRQIMTRFGGSPEARVGFLEGATYPDGTSVAMVAAINEFGAPSRGQPPRPFFRRMIAEKKGEWGPALGIQLKKTNYNQNAALEIVGMGIEGQLRQSIVDLTDPPLAKTTIEAKSRGGVGKLHGTMGPAKPLIDTGYMLSRVDHEVIG